MHQNKHAHTPTGPHPYFDISATQAYSNKSNTDKLCETMQNQCYSPVKKKQRNLCVRFEPSALLEFALPLESCSDINARPTSCLIVILSLNVLFLQYFLFNLSVLSIFSRSANIRPVHSNWPLSSLCHYNTILLIICKCVLGHGPILQSKVFFRNCLVHL